VIRIRNIKFDDSLFYSLEDVDLNHFLREKIKQIIEILDIQSLSSLSSNTIINNIINTQNKKISVFKDTEFFTLSNKALIHSSKSNLILNSILNQLLISDFTSEPSTILNQFEQIYKYLLNIYKESASDNK